MNLTIGGIIMLAASGILIWYLIVVSEDNDDYNL